MCELSVTVGAKFSWLYEWCTSYFLLDIAVIGQGIWLYLIPHTFSRCHDFCMLGCRCLYYLSSHHNEYIGYTRCEQSKQGGLRDFSSIAIAIMIFLYKPNLTGRWRYQIIRRVWGRRVENVRMPPVKLPKQYQTAQNTVISLIADRDCFASLAEKERNFSWNSVSKGSDVMVYIQVVNILDSELIGYTKRKVKYLH